MTVGELKNKLEGYEDDMIIVCQPTGSMYGEHIGDIEDDKAIRAFYGNDYEALILTSEGQCGAVCDEDEVDLK